MAISRGAGTEIIRSASFEQVESTAQTLIQGVQHHIYTVLSIIFFNTGGTDKGTLQLIGYDSYAGTTAQEFNLVNVECAAGSTFVWNDKFSFNGYEPTDFTGAMNAADDQDAIADQGSSVAQYLKFFSTSNSTGWDVHITYIDQNNA